MKATGKFGEQERKPMSVEEMPSGLREQNACYKVMAIPLEMIQANDYNPNAVATPEMRLLYISIKEDTYTMPTVVIFDPNINKYVIIDGFHRYSTMLRNKDIYEKNDGYLPCVVLDKDINQRMASTVRHNRARGKHSVTGMGNIVFDMLKNGVEDAEICDKLGLEPQELIRLKYITGFAKMFKDHQYSKAWESEQQIKAMKAYHDKMASEEHKGTALEWKGEDE